MTRFINIEEMKGQQSISLAPNERPLMDGLEFLSKVPMEYASAAFLDPDWRVWPDEEVENCLKAMDRALIPGGHAFLWANKTQATQGVETLFEGTELQVVDMIVWDKGLATASHRSLSRAMLLFVAQKFPYSSKCWRQGIPDVHKEFTGGGFFRKPISLLKSLLDACTYPGQAVLEPASRSDALLLSARQTGRVYFGARPDTEKEKSMREDA